MNPHTQAKSDLMGNSLISRKIYLQLSGQKSHNTEDAF